MNKHIIFSLLFLVNLATHAMDSDKSKELLTTSVLYSSDIVSHITKQLCMNRHLYIREDMIALCCTNKFFHNYYSAENNKQTIIRTIARDIDDADDGSVASVLCCHTISKKIKYFAGIANNKNAQFTEEDLKKTWYLNVTTGFFSTSLLRAAIDNNDYEKAQLLINHSELDLTLSELLRLEGSIVWVKIRNRHNKDALNKLQLIAHCVSEKKSCYESKKG